MIRKELMKRFLYALCALSFALLWSSATFAEPVKIGFISPAAPPALAAMSDVLSGQLAMRGLVRDRDFTFELRAAEGKPERLPALAKGLMDAHVAAILAFSYPAARAAKDVTSTVPIVIFGAGEPVETGFAASLSHPGGNVTGLSDLSSELSVKRLELLRIAVPGLKRVAMLWNADDLGMTSRYKAASAAALGMGIVITPFGVREPEDFSAAFAGMTGDMPDGILMVTDILTRLNRKKVYDFAAAHRVPAIYETEDFARDGGLMSYGPDRKEALERIADQLARILKGANPSDLPFEQPTRFRFVINRKTADSGGIAVPDSLLDRADEVIE
jgi:putative tryptophan/tyrosine transport system substrate-binding protein